MITQMKAALVIMNLMPMPVVTLYPTREACLEAAQEHLMSRKPFEQWTVHCGPIVDESGQPIQDPPKIEGEEKID
jgi:hypothetical protein